MKYPTDEGDFKHLPEETKQYIFSFLRGSPIVSGVCKNFNNLNTKFVNNLLEFMKGKIYEIRISDNLDIIHKFPLHYQMMLFYKLNSAEESELSLVNRFFKLLSSSLCEQKLIPLVNFVHQVDDFRKILPSLFPNGKDHYIKNLQYINLESRPNFLFNVEKEKIHDFLSFIDTLKIKSNNCEFINKPLELSFDLNKICSIL